MSRPFSPIETLRLLAAFLLSAALASTSDPAEKPNIIFLLADDIGYADLSCYGAKHVKTPNLDRLAAQGCKFTDAHSPASTCTPTRRAFLTGVYSWRQEVGSSIAPGDAPLTIPVGTPTVASIMKQAGYRTGHGREVASGARAGGRAGLEWRHQAGPAGNRIRFVVHHGRDGRSRADGVCGGPSRGRVGPERSHQRELQGEESAPNRPVGKIPNC